MSDTTASLRRKINSAGDLQSVVRTMKALAASNIGQYETSVRAFVDYYRSVELGLSIRFRKSAPAALRTEGKRRTDEGPVGAVVFGSDQGLVGQFNDVVADFALRPWPLFPANPRSGRSANACMRACRTRDCRWSDSSPCRIPSRPSPRSSGRFSSRARRATPG